jgi:membrane-bound lytic murein transglycosylase D
VGFWTRGGRWSRTTTLLAALAAAGSGAAGSGAPAANQPTAPTTTQPAAPPVHQQYIKIPPAHPPGPKPAEVNRLRTLIESGENALEEKDWDGAQSWSDMAEALMDEWPEETLKLPEVVALHDRLIELQQHLPDTEEVPAMPDPGIKEAVEVAPLSPDELRTELEQVKGAEAGAVFDLGIDCNDKVLAWVKLFTTEKKGFMERALSRASQYLPMVRQIFAEEHIPQDLAFLAVIESGYINSASSYAKAVGMWQFMRSTGRIYGLGGNAWVEERRDPVKATRAAARYLRRLYEVSGDWYLALVGYNAGPLTTERAILNLGSRNFWDMYRSRWLRDQTKNYVPELCAAVLVGRFPERYGLRIEQLPPYAYETVDVDRMTSLAVLARYAETDVDALKELNPELLRATTPPGHYTLRVPPGQSSAAARALARIPANQRLDFQPYRLRKGDSAVRVAARFHLGVEDLLDANGITRAQFRPGRVIHVPPPPSAPIDDRDLRSKVERAQIIEDKPLENLPAIPPSGAGAPLEPAREESAPGAEPAAAEAPAAAVRPAVKAAPRIPAAEIRPAYHVVKRGETLFAIAERYGLEVKDLRKWNKLRRGAIQVGQRLKLKR